MNTAKLTQAIKTNTVTPGMIVSLPHAGGWKVYDCCMTKAQALQVETVRRTQTFIADGYSPELAQKIANTPSQRQPRIAHLNNHNYSTMTTGWYLVH